MSRPRLLAVDEDGVTDVPVAVVGNAIVNTAAVTVKAGGFLALSYTVTLDADADD